MVFERQDLPVLACLPAMQWFICTCLLACSAIVCKSTCTSLCRLVEKIKESIEGEWEKDPLQLKIDKLTVLFRKCKPSMFI